MPRAKQPKRRAASVKSSSSVIVPDPVVIPEKRKRTQKRSPTVLNITESNISVEDAGQSSTSPPEKMPTADEIALALLNRMRNEPSSQEPTSQHQPSLAELVNPPAQQTQASTSTMRNPSLVIPPMPCSSSTVMNTVVHPVNTSLLQDNTSMPLPLNYNLDSQREGTTPITFSSVNLIKNSLPLAYHVNEKNFKFKPKSNFKHAPVE